MKFHGNDIRIEGGKVTIHLDVTLPPGASRDKPCPVILVADRRSCFPTPIPADQLKAIDKTHAEFRRMATERGYALIMWNVNEVAPDCWLLDRYVKMKPEELPPNAWGVFGLYGGEPDGRHGDTWGTIRAWAWGHSRVMDWIESQSNLDAKRVAVCGHSRLGKAALVAGVTDERFLMAYSNDSGVGGAHPHRLWKPGVCTLKFVNERHLHWLCLNSRKFEADERNMPHDMDEFLALMTPRYLYVASASDDQWAGPEGEQFGFCIIRNRLVLAAAKWRLDHDNAQLPSLEILVPNYIESVPQDPYSKNGGTLRYHSGTGVVWSVGKDGNFDFEKMLENGKCQIDSILLREAAFRLFSAP